MKEKRRREEMEKGFLKIPFSISSLLHFSSKLIIQLAVSAAIKEVNNKA